MADFAFMFLELYKPAAERVLGEQVAVALRKHPGPRAAAPDREPVEMIGR